VSSPKAKSLTRALTPLYRCSTWLSYGPYGMPEPYVEKEVARLSQLAISAGSN